MTAALTAEKSQLYEMEDGSLIPQLAQQVQFTVKVGKFLNPHLSFRRVPRFSSTVISSAFCKLICETPGKVKWLHWHTESEFEGLRFSAEVIGRKGEGSSKLARPFYQSMVGRQSDAANQRIWVLIVEKKSVQDMHELDRAMWELSGDFIIRSYFLEPSRLHLEQHEHGGSCTGYRDALSPHEYLCIHSPLGYHVFAVRWAWC